MGYSLFWDGILSCICLDINEDGGIHTLECVSISVDFWYLSSLKADKKQEILF